MKRRWLRRLVYLLVLIVWIPVMAFPFVAFTLATKGELQLGGESHLRFFMVQETGANGVGIEWQRELFQPDSCRRTSIAYLMWEGEGEGVSYCQCFDVATGDPLPVTGSICSLP
jgi:hypothetical protein